MKDRIIRTLTRLANSPLASLQQDSVYQELDRHLKAHAQPAQQNVVQQAQITLDFILNDYSSFSVSTIERFFQRIVRAFARELNIPLGYEVEMRQDLVLQQLVDTLLLNLSSEPDLARLLRDYLERSLAEDRGWQVEKPLKQLGRQIFQEEYQKLAIDFPEPDITAARTLAFAGRLLGIQAKFEAFFREKSLQAIAILDEFGLVADDFYYKAKGPYGYLTRFTAARGGKSPEYSPNSYILKVIRGEVDMVRKQSSNKADADAAVSGGLWDILVEMVQKVETDYADYQAAKQVGRTLHSLGVLSTLRRQLTEYRNDQKQLLISDTGFMLRDIVQEGYGSPFIYEKVGTRYQHYLIDEFQDTSDMQWDNLFPLVSDALAQGAGSLLVGDVKQSIYRWRNGNMELLLNKAEYQVLQQGLPANIERLNSNWRTGASIVRFNNVFFKEASQWYDQSELMPDPGHVIAAAYKDVAQLPQHEDIPAYVEFHFIPKEHEHPHDPELGLVKWRETACERTASTIRALQTEGFQGADITLLVRTNGDGIEIATYLQTKGIPVVSAESLLLIASPRVRFMETLLQVLQAEQVRLHRAQLYYWYSQVHKEALNHGLFDPQNLPEGLTRFEAMLPLLRKTPVYICVERLIQLFPELDHPDAYLQGFQDLVLHYSATQDASIGGFLGWWEDERTKAAIAAAPDPNAVRIMTIHKAKGLEFPVLIMPFADWDLRPKSSGTIWVQPDTAPYNEFPFLPLHPGNALLDTPFAADYAHELLFTHLDNLNLLYVAFTRPQYRLYVFTYRPVKESKRARTKLPSRLSDLLNLLIRELEYTDLAEQQEGVYSLGTAVPGTDLPAGHDAGIKGFAQPRLEERLEGWEAALRIRFSANRFLDGDMRTYFDQIETGNLFHDVLGEIETQADIPLALDRLQMQGYFAPSQRIALEEQIGKILKHPEAATWFDGSWEVRNEAEILAKNGMVLRPDRVMLQPGKAIVVDYKTGKPHTKYHRQLRGYMDALAEMGYGEVEGYLYYILLGEVEEVPLA